MVLLIIVIVLSLGVNIYQALNLKKAKEVQYSLNKELIKSTDLLDVSRNIIVTLYNKLKIYETPVDTKEIVTETKIEDEVPVPVKKTRKKK